MREPYVLLRSMADARVPGEVVFSLHSKIVADTAAAGAMAMPTSLGVAAEAPQGTGVAAVDEMLTRWRTKSVRHMRLTAARTAARAADLIRSSRCRRRTRPRA